MHNIIKELLLLLDEISIQNSDVITWGAPIPSFGDASHATIATLGLNPSNKEFMDNSGQEIDGHLRRFHTLKSLNISSWKKTSKEEIELISDSCTEYFLRNPYNSWFKALDYLISGTSASYYNKFFHAVHLDLIPLATHSKWSALNSTQKNTLLRLSSSSLGNILKGTPVKLLILNGSTVIDNFQKISNVQFSIEHLRDWDLLRREGSPVRGFAYKGIVTKISDITLEKPILALGFNHNIQSSFGVSLQVKNSIKNWITQESAEVL